uniref:Mitochondrial import inner membrane translocase subunit TIM50 n=1 Tax=Babesia bovis TaxID=5865 RepID=S6B9Q7_BABBO|nr:NLI interacting factor-like phosphatase family protein [Babesia bovis]
MSVLDHFYSALGIILESSYYIIGAGTLYIIIKVIEFKVLGSTLASEDLFAKRVKPDYCLVLDLDDTILHSVSTRGNNETSSVALTVGNRTLNFVVYKRPHLDTFLMEMRKYYEIVLYSTSRRRYVDACLSDACVNHLIDRKLYRNDCFLDGNGTYIKDLSKVSSDMSKVVLLNNPLMEGFPDLPNVVPIDSWFGGLSDTALLDVMPFLKALTQLDDVRYILGLRCSDNRGYSGQLPVCIAESGDASDDSPRAGMLPEISDDMDNWDIIGARLTTRVKEIFTNMGFNTDNPVTPVSSNQL